MKATLISIVIPCYNHGQYLREAIESVEKNAKYPYELIIVNDGSTDERTLNELNELQRENYYIIHQENQGLAAARNNAITVSKGKYIIPLDSDNKLHQNYLIKAVDVLEQNPSIDIVYGNPFFFVMDEGLKNVGAYTFSRIIRGNFIDACAIYKKSIWEKVKGYDGKMPAMGHEDWEFWIHASLIGANFYYLNELCFYYRSLPNSMAKTVSTPSQDRNREYVYKKHYQMIIERLLEENNLLSNIPHYLEHNKLKSIAKIVLGRKI